VITPCRCLQWADEVEKWLPSLLLPGDINLVLSRDNSRLAEAPISIISYGLLTNGKAKEALAGLGRIVALHHRSSTSYQIC
jgi:hypothetical protein